ncbi:glycosyltransferase [Pseudarcicella hirudinis]|uniref:glycosyltransferase n=1 Tax=Pseudarcicella hirudinis TaxID=1079859 RepID=UPI0035E60A37
MTENIKILIPLYNDWDALELLLTKIKHSVTSELFAHLNFVIVDDCSSIECDVNRFGSYKLEIIRLHRNVSHQKAIALGLSYITKETEFSKSSCNGFGRRR